MKIWKVGLIGTGWWSEKHLKAWSRIPGAEIAALCNRTRPKLEARASEFGVASDQLYDSVKAMLQHADIDIVDIVTGPESHLEYVRLAAAAGKHILCQKPFAPTYEEAQEMVQLAQEAGVRLMVTENWRWLEPFRLIKEYLNRGMIGKLHMARYIHSDYYTPRMADNVSVPQPFFKKMPKLLFYEMGPHWFDTWRYLFGTPDRLYAVTKRISPYIEGEDSGIVLLGYDTGFYGLMDMSWASRQLLNGEVGEDVFPLNLEQLNVEGEDGTLKLYTSGKITLVAGDGSGEETLAAATGLDHEQSHYLLQSHFIDALDSGEPFQTEGADNLITMKMVFGVYESAATYLPVRIGGG